VTGEALLEHMQEHRDTIHRVKCKISSLLAQISMYEASVAPVL
jgi:hypothetical protein